MLERSLKAKAKATAAINTAAVIRIVATGVKIAVIAGAIAVTTVAARSIRNEMTVGKVAGIMAMVVGSVSDVRSNAQSGLDSSEISVRLGVTNSDGRITGESLRTAGDGSDRLNASVMVTFVATAATTIIARIAIGADGILGTMMADIEIMDNGAVTRFIAAMPSERPGRMRKRHFDAMSETFRGIRICHRTIRTMDTTDTFINIRDTLVQIF